MPPARNRHAADDAKDSKHHPYSNTSHRRKNPATAKDAANTNTTNAALDAAPTTAQPGGSLIDWAATPASLLSAYRTSYTLATPSAFQSSLHAAVLTAPGMGLHSPTMAKRRRATAAASASAPAPRKQRPEQLAQVVRKHFNDLAVSETEVVVDFVYAVRNQDKNFRMRFAPAPPHGARQYVQGHAQQQQQQQQQLQPPAQGYR